MSLYPELKAGDQMVRYCKRQRSETFTAIHDFTIFSHMFTADGNEEFPVHIQSLFMYLADVFIDGMPIRDTSASQSAPDKSLKKLKFKMDLVDLAKEANYRGWGKEQHPIVQRHLLYNDQWTVATEVPVYNDSSNGFIDIVRVHPYHELFGEWMIEIADFKPDAAKDKKAPAQVNKYRNLLSYCAVIPKEKIFCSFFDDTDGYLLVHPELTVIK